MKTIDERRFYSWFKTRVYLKQVLKIKTSMNERQKFKNNFLEQESKNFNEQVQAIEKNRFL